MRRSIPSSVTAAILAVAVLLLAGAGERALATGMPAVTISDTEGTDHFAEFTLGWLFHTNAEVIVTHLGVFDDKQDGLEVSHQIGIFDDAGNLLASTTVAAGKADPLIAQFRYHPLSANLTLAADKDYTIGAFFQSTADKVVFPDAPGFKIDQRLTFKESRNHGDTALGAPDVTGPEGAGYFGPNLVIVPGLSGLALLGIGALGLLGHNWRRGTLTLRAAPRPR